MRERDVELSRKRMKKLITNRAYRTDLIARLINKLLHKEPWKELILCVDDPEVAATVSEFDMRCDALKARHVIDFLQVFILGTEPGGPFTWKYACIYSSINNYCNVYWRTIMCWYHNMLKTMIGELCFTKLTNGAS